MLKSPEAVADIFRRESVNFINDLLASHTIFYTTNFDDSGSKSQSVNVVKSIIESMFPKTAERTDYYQKWVKNNKLILAKAGGKEYIQGEAIPEGVSVELNPLLEKYLYTDSLLANNLRLELTGSEIAHPDKSKIDINERLIEANVTPDKVPELSEILEDGTYKFNDRVNDLVWLN